MRKLKVLSIGNLVPILLVFLYNEYLIYIHVISKCEWPMSNEADATRLLLIADTHLLGSRNGHWFDKLRREWQQLRSYQTTLEKFNPNFAVILGDLTDEGKWCSNQEWEYYTERANQVFSTSTFDTKLFVLVGNHDVGFHYNIDDNKIERFNRSFTRQLVHLETVANDQHFVFVNSMALLNDGCKFCRKALIQLKQINTTLNCMKTKACKDLAWKNSVYRQPIIFTHMPLYRYSDAVCAKDTDTEPVELLSTFKQNHDCLSKPSTKQVLI
jgi:hypothetical protein